MFTPTFNPTETMIRCAISDLQTSYRQVYGSFKPKYADLIAQAAMMTLTAIAHTDALYHDVEHTILVTMVGQEMLRGKYLLEGAVTPQEWTHFIIALLCHDVGYLKGICRNDQPDQHRYATGVGNEQVPISPGATDASLALYHVDRSQQFVAETFGNYHLIQVETIQRMIEQTRFPIPDSTDYQDTNNYPGLARAADLIGQLADPHYLEKLPALFHEFAEVGTNKTMGYQTPDDLRTSFPDFFRTVVYPLIQPALHYLQATQQGRQIVQELFNNVAIAEQPHSAQANCLSTSNPVFCQQRYHFYLQDDAETLIGSSHPSASINEPPLSYFCLNSGMPIQG
ncbi:Npun_R2479 family HD domain-containing metalloprotein [Leptolyngbya sp. Cla-17]|uniref:Npun_R2479 family HD domain-containing metalloprotein n=1 Tax=Leptolyngbya sp. Cla-17 TaxID=2803751 RepID=UPI0018D69BDE|nr:Npun_R2479 family HD domain-containing metalloprotein [Leptolyngbya sp. Cla-17]